MTAPFNPTGTLVAMADAIKASQPTPELRVFESGSECPPMGTSATDCDGDTWTVLAEEVAILTIPGPLEEAGDVGTMEDWDDLTRLYGPLTEVRP